jgi:AcrR family transcriptional regulator
MKKQRSQYRGTSDRRTQIIDAALLSFTEEGFNNTTIQDIRRRSGASNGSIYHHFGSKERLAAEVYLQGVVEYQRQMVEEAGKTRDAREGIHAIIRHHIRWVCEHPAWTRYLFRMRHADFMVHAEKAISETNREFEALMGNFFRMHMASGAIRALPKELYISMVFGPPQELSRLWMVAEIPDNPDDYIEEIGEAVWRSLKTDPGPDDDLKPAGRKTKKPTGGGKCSSMK